MKNTLALFAIASLLSFVLSCSKKETDNLQPSRELTVQTAHEWFNEHSSYNRPGGRSKGSKFNDFSPDWSKAKAKTDEKNRKYVQVPLKHKNKYIRVFYVKRNEKLIPIELESTFYSAIIYSDGSNLTDIVKEDVPEDEYVSRNGSAVNPADFTGKVLLWSWDEEIIGGMVYKDGRAIRGIFPASKSGRQVPITTTYCDWNRGCKNGGFGDLTIYSTTTSSTGSFGDCAYPGDAYTGGDDYYCSPWDRVATHTFTEWIEVPDDPIPGSGPGNEGGNSTMPAVVQIPVFGDKIDPIKELECFHFSSGAKLTIYVDQPIPNQRKVWAPIANVGHTFVGIEQDGIRRVFGYYPSVEFTLPNSDYAGEIHDDSGHYYDISISRNISAAELYSIVYYVSNYPGWYSLNRFNCTDFGISVAALGGIDLPRTSANEPGFVGRSPGNLGEDVRERTLINGESRAMSNIGPSKFGKCN